MLSHQVTAGVAAPRTSVGTFFLPESLFMPQGFASVRSPWQGSPQGAGTLGLCALAPAEGSPAPTHRPSWPHVAWRGLAAPVWSAVGPGRRVCRRQWGTLRA